MGRKTITKCLKFTRPLKSVLSNLACKILDRYLRKKKSILNMKKYFFLFLLFLSVSGYAQHTINNYKYVLVPEKFSFLKEPNQYKLNAISKMLLEEKGFTVNFDNAELPDEIANNKCKALNFEVLEKNSMFSTNLTLLLKDCKGNILFKSKQGKSREKEFDVAYNLALRDAFSSLNEVQYVYTPSDVAEQQVTATATTTIPAVNAIPVAVSQSPVKTIATEATQSAGTLYAQRTVNGYQLIDTAPKIVLTLLKTSVEDYFIADNGSAHGVVFKSNENWFFEYYKDGKLIAEKLSIKF